MAKLRPKQNLSFLVIHALLSVSDLRDIVKALSLSHTLGGVFLNWPGISRLFRIYCPWNTGFISRSYIFVTRTLGDRGAVQLSLSLDSFVSYKESVRSDPTTTSKSAKIKRWKFLLLLPFTFNKMTRKFRRLVDVVLGQFSSVVEFLISFNPTPFPL